MQEQAQQAETSRFPPLLRIQPSASAETMLEHMRSALGRGLPEVRICKRHQHRLCIAGGGPSFGDTYKHLDGYVAAINGSLRFLLEHDVVPDACGLLDPGEHIADLIEADRRVRYFVASTCHPRVFDKLRNCAVHLWHPSGTPGVETFMQEARPRDWLLVGGGTTMGVRWLNLGYLCGFRTFRVHGLDSSFRNGSTHAYPDRRDGGDHLEIGGRQTSLNFLAQISDFFGTMERFRQPDMEETDVQVFGDGLLQERWRARAC